MASDEEQPSYFRNLISVAGTILSVIFFVVISCLFLLDFFNAGVSPYLGIVTYMLAPVALIFSLLLIPLGAWIERSQRRKRGYVAKFPIIDFNNPVHQRWTYTTWGVLTVFLLFSAIGIYRVYNFTESNVFCGTLCHTVMEPEYTAYHESSHARVNCTECHVGSGFEGYVRSKLAGAYQVYSVIAKAYPKPIPTPIKSLRPAQEACEQCHWPQKFFGALEKDHRYFLPDESNSEWKTQMLMFVNKGASSVDKKNAGIHWHVTGGHKISYITTDEKRQIIPWVKKVEPDGKEEIFVDQNSGFTAENPPQGEMRMMDCMDCHNRPSHIYKAPVPAVNEAMEHGAIDPSLPYIKRMAVAVLQGHYATKEDAAKGIRGTLQKFYKEKYPEIWATREVAIEDSIDGVIGVYGKNFFPEMNVSWKAYPNNIGHLMFPGCFRCHDGSHKTKDGKSISRDCSNCHAIISQGFGTDIESRVEGLKFKHPGPDVGDSWADTNCYDCHTGDTA